MKNSDRQTETTLRKVMSYIRRYWGYLGMSIVLAAVTVALTLYIPILTGQAVDHILGKGSGRFCRHFCDFKKDGSDDCADCSCTVDHECVQQ